MKWTVLGAALGAALAGDAAAGEVAAVSFGELLGEADLRETLAVEGTFQVTQVPRLAELRRAVFADAAACARVAQELVPAKFEDGTVRRSFVAATQMGKAYNMDVSSLFPGHKAPAECIAFEKRSYELRNLVTRVSSLFFSQLDKMCGMSDGTRMPVARALGSAKDYESMWEFLHQGEHLEHVHAYSADCSNGAKTGAKTLDLHTDDGLFIAVVPSMWIPADGANPLPVSASHGFYIQDSQGRVVEPELKDDGDVLLFMLGAGAAKWFGLCPPMRPVPHALVISEACGAVPEDALRMWYGRMFLPPQNAVDEGTNMTFAELRKAKVNAMLASDDEAGEGMSMGCSDHRQLRDLANSCSKGEFYCWMMCRAFSPVSGCTLESTEDDFKCISTEDGSEWLPGDDHCENCVITCEEKKPEANTEGLCNGIGTAMYMSGFVGIDPAEACPIILFEPFTLDTPAKYAIGTIGTFLFGMLTEVVIWLRRKNAGREKELAKPLEYTVYMMLYITQVTFGYFAMLLAMTYSAILFAAIVLGLAAGHFTLNMKRRKPSVANDENEDRGVGETSDPCCQFMEEVVPDKPSSKKKATKDSKGHSKPVEDPEALNDAKKGESCCGSSNGGSATASEEGSY